MHAWKRWLLVLASTLVSASVAAAAAQVRPGQLSKEERAVYDRLTKELTDGDKDPGNDWNGRNPNQGLVPTIVSRAGVWPWGELVYGTRYETHLTVTNRCDSAETVSIFVRNLPYLTLPRKVLVGPGEEKKVPAAIVMPPEPPPPFVPPGAPAPPWGWVPPPFAPGAGAAPFHQPNFVDLEPRKGEVVLWHPMQNKCRPERTTYQVTGHIHFGPPAPDPGGGGPERIATPDACEVYWLTGEPPAQLGEKDCTDAMRGFAVRWHEAIVSPYVDRDPAAWSWLPPVSRIEQMSVPELLEMKRRGDALMRR